MGPSRTGYVCQARPERRWIGPLVQIRRLFVPSPIPGWPRGHNEEGQGQSQDATDNSDEWPTEMKPDPSDDIGVLGVDAVGSGAAVPFDDEARHPIASDDTTEEQLSGIGTDGAAAVDDDVTVLVGRLPYCRHHVPLGDGRCHGRGAHDPVGDGTAEGLWAEEDHQHHRSSQEKDPSQSPPECGAAGFPGGQVVRVIGDACAVVDRFTVEEETQAVQGRTIEGLQSQR